MRIFQLVFSVWGFFACRDFSVTLTMDCDNKLFKRGYEIEYPFEFNEPICLRKVDNSTMFLSVDSSSGAQFFALTAALSLLYAVFIIFVYAYLDEMYKSKPEFPMAVSSAPQHQHFHFNDISWNSFSGLCADWNFSFLLVSCNVWLQQRWKCSRENLWWSLHQQSMSWMCSADQQF